MDRKRLVEAIQEKKSMLCVGLDTAISKLPEGVERSIDGVLTFNKTIIEATENYAVAYKPNVAFYEAMGPAGWQVLKSTLQAIPSTHFKIADAKRGDIGNTTEQYAKAFFEELGADALTVNPYMGSDSLIPYLSYQNKWIIVLVATSNPSAKELEWHTDKGKRLFEKVIEVAIKYGNPNNIMFVVGATRPQLLKEIRNLAPEYFFLVPGVGAQGGTVSDVVEAAAISEQGGLLINSTRGVIYASQKEDYAAVAERKAKDLQQQMSAWFV